jgi:hypothetical protein
MDQTLAHAGVLQIEPTDVCNLRCTMCAPHHDGWETVHGVPKGFLDVQVYERVVQGLVDDDLRFDHVIFQWLGDPSLHPELEHLVGVAQQKLGDRVGYLRVDTNAIVLTPARMDRLIQVYARRPEVPLLLVFTIDAHTAETYARVKGQDALDRVRKHVRHFIMRRARLQEQLAGPIQLNVELQFVLQPGNAHEAGAFVQYWSDFLACHGHGVGHSDIQIKRLSVGGGAQGQLEADLLYDRTLSELGLRAHDRGHVEIKVWQDRPWESPEQAPAPRQPCPGLWWTPVIRHDGRLMACCADLGGELELGDLRTSGFLELWNGPVAQAKRLEHIQGRFEGVCGACGGINWYRTQPEHVRETLERAGRMDLWDQARARLSAGD